MIDKKKHPRWSVRSVERDPTLSSVLSFIDGMTAKQIERKCGVTANTINRWRSGKTRRPQNVTMDFALRAAGFKRIIVPDERTRK